MAAALDLTRTHGLKAATMRGIARQAGGYEAMSLYTHVASADDIRNLMLETIIPGHGETMTGKIAEATTPGQAYALRAGRDWLIELWAASGLDLDTAAERLSFLAPMLWDAVARHTTTEEETAS